MVKIRIYFQKCNLQRSFQFYSRIENWNVRCWLIWKSINLMAVFFIEIQSNFSVSCKKTIIKIIIIVHWFVNVSLKNMASLMTLYEQKHQYFASILIIFVQNHKHKIVCGTFGSNNDRHRHLQLPSVIIKTTSGGKWVWIQISKFGGV